MNVGELFVNLGVKGSEKTVSAINSARKSMSELGSMSLEAKAGILAAVYAFEQLMAASGRVGTGLTNFEALTGISAQNLQKWQYAARQAGVSADEMASSIKGVQNTMTNYLLHGQTPAGFGIFASQTGFDYARANDTLYVLGKLNEFAKTQSPQIAASIGKGFGLSESVIAGMRRGVFRDDLFKRAPTYSERDLRALDQANIAWSNLANKIEMAFGHFNAKHGNQLVQDISKVTEEVLKLVDALTTLAEKIKVFKILGKVAEAGGFVVNGLTQGVDDITGKGRNDFGKGAIGRFIEWRNEVDRSFYKLMTPYLDHSKDDQAQKPIQVQQNIHFHHDVNDHQKNAQGLKRATQGAISQNPARGGGH